MFNEEEYMSENHATQITFDDILLLKPNAFTPNRLLVSELRLNLVTHEMGQR